MQSWLACLSAVCCQHCPWALGSADAARPESVAESRSHCKPLPDLPLPGLLLQLAGLEDEADSLNTRVLKLTKGSRKYRDGIAELTTSQQGFADFLEEFCGGTDEESMRLGELMAVLNEQASTPCLEKGPDRANTLTVCSIIICACSFEGCCLHLKLWGLLCCSRLPFQARSRDHVQHYLLNFLAMPPVRWLADDQVCQHLPRAGQLQ